MKVHPSLLYLFLILLFPETTLGQDDSHSHYDMKNGLAGITVYGMTQDRDGYMWFGTETGLSRFDGSNFKNFSIDDGLPGNQVFGLYTDTKNRIWIATFKNEICYYSNGIIHNAKNDTTLKKIALKTHVIRITEGKDGDLLINCLKTSYLLKNNGQVVLIPAMDRTITQSFFYPISGMLNVNVSLINIPSYVKKRIAGKLLLVPPYRYAGGLGAQYAAHNLWLQPSSVQDTMYFFPAGDTQCRIIKLPNNTGHIRQVNNTTYAFIRQYKGVTLFDINGPGIFRDYFKGYSVNDVMADRENNLWFSTRGFGVFKIGKGNFKNYSFEDLGVNYINLINSNLYVGTDNSKLWVVKPIANNLQVVTDHKKPQQIILKLKDLITKKQTGYIVCAGSNFLNIKLKRDNIEAIKTVQYYHDTLLIASSNGCYLYSAVDYRLLKTIYQGRVICAYQRNGIAYVGTVECLRRISIANPGKSDEILLYSQISQIVEAADGALWLSSNEHGIFRYNNGRITTQIRKQNGLASDICSSIFISGNTLWVGTDKGLNQIDIRSDNPIITRHVTEADGLISDIVNTIYIAGHYVYVGTAAGMTVFDEKGIPDQASCNLKIDRVMVSEKEKSSYADNLIIPHEDNNIQFDLNIISFLPGIAPTLHYRLLGLSDDWRISKERTLNFLSLQSGKYTLQIQAVNKLGGKSPMIQYRFEILQTLWEKWWFRLIIVIALMALTAISVVVVIKRSHFKEKEKLLNAQKIMELEQMALRAQMNPHFIFNSLNSLQQYIISQDVKNANNYLSRFASLVRQTLDNSPKIYIPVAEEIVFLDNYLALEQQQSLGAFLYTITVDPGIDQQAVVIPNMVLQPYIENAVKHGVRQLKDRGVITVSLRMDTDEKYLECIICDNGPGISAQSKIKRRRPINYVSHGMSITEKRISTINQLNAGLKDIFVTVEDLNILNSSIRGTKVTIRFQI